jgi:hypothetical protein
MGWRGGIAVKYHAFLSRVHTPTEIFPLELGFFDTNDLNIPLSANNHTIIKSFARALHFVFSITTQSTSADFIYYCF